MPIYSVFALSALNGLAVSAGRVLLTLYALKLGASVIAIGVLAATLAVFPMLLSWLSGRLSDRVGSRWLLTFGAAGSALAMLVPYLSPSLETVFAAGAMVGLCQAFFNVPIQNLVGLLSKRSDRAKNYSNYSLAGSVAGFLGPLFAGFSIDHSGHALACLYLSVLSLVVAALLAIRGGMLPSGARDSAPAGNVRELLSDTGVRRVLAATSVQHCAQDVFQFYLPVYAHDIGLSASAIGVVLAMNSAAALVSRLLLTRLVEWLKEQQVLACAFFLGAASFMLVPFFESSAALTLTAFMFGVGMGCATPITMTLMYNLSAAGRSGEALGLRLTVNHLTRVVGPLVFGSIASAFGLPPVFWVNALMLGTGGMLSRHTKGG